MQNNCFKYTKVLDATTKIDYYLPKGLYQYTGLTNSKEIIHVVEIIVKKFISAYEITVIKSDEACTSGLKKVRKNSVTGFS
ncbi:hypothetical protein [Chryseobacterium cheonjiense]|uniref:Uncharacterized protein n=1 Tax=Chryseobacterium cheonjiense TaxID=2728845 RepID=A0A7Y0A4S0_9FLAO|nr:hypothetical protein [Chryseobacterium cheonjiense]NML56692.1 hypothetical protein [Chryseobacterium cheonjiense]